MTGGSVRLDRGSTHPRLLPSLALTGAVVAALWISMEARAQQTAPASQPAPSYREIESQLEKALANLNSMSPVEVRNTLEPLLKNDLTGIRAATQISAYMSLANAYEGLAQAARMNNLDPGAERKKDDALDAAVAAYVKAGKAAADAQDLASADQAYNRALTHRPNSAPALLGMARLLSSPRNKKPLQALQAYQDYLNATNQGRGTVYEPQLYVEMGRVYADANLWHQAMKAYREALKNGLDNAEVAGLLARCHMALNEPEEAFKQAEKAISKDKSQPTYYRLYAELLIQRNRFPDAIQPISQAISIAKQRLAANPGERTTLVVLSDCYSTYVRAIEAIVARNPSDLQSRLTLTGTMQDQLYVMELLSYHNALDFLQTAPARDREDPRLLEEQIRLEKLIRHKDLRFTCEQLLKIRPGNQLARETLAALDSASQPAPARP